ncbi:MAG: RHS repeat-associated core domain-containing protein [Gemmataceae bacterium]|nr:RHS repeat-associated core domain-containing protein [Gemmataceae bacterium]
MEWRGSHGHFYVLLFDDWQVVDDRVGGQVKIQYVWSPVYVDAMMLRDRDTNGDSHLDQRLYVVQDANYNVTALFDNSDNLVERYVYDPFGSVTVLDAGWNVLAASAFAWLYLHQGGRFDATSGLYHFRHRDYSPTLGRWTSLDPIRYSAGDVNLYRALANSPTNAVDPNGLDWVETVAGWIGSGRLDWGGSGSQLGQVSGPPPHRLVRANEPFRRGHGRYGQHGADPSCASGIRF